MGRQGIYVLGQVWQWAYIGAHWHTYVGAYTLGHTMRGGRGEGGKQSCRHAATCICNGELHARVHHAMHFGQLQCRINHLMGLAQGKFNGPP